MKEFLRLAVVVMVIGLGVGYVLADWQSAPPGPPPYSCDRSNPPPGCTTPINVSNTTQSKAGSLIIDDILFSSKILAVNKLGVGFQATPALDPTALLDVNGQIRIRGPSTGPYAPGVGKVLTAYDAGTETNTGLARWETPVAGVSEIREGYGIDIGKYDPTPPGTVDYTVTSSAGVTYIKINSGETQQRISSSCASPKAMTAVAQNGVPTCQSFVTTARANLSSGLTLTDESGVVTTNAVSGPIALAVNAGPGLAINNNQLALNVIETAGAGDGLRIDTTDNTVKFETCANDQTWKYNAATAKWECASLPPANYIVPGDSLMYLRVKDTANVAPPSCPTNWIEAPPNTSSPYGNYTGNENVGGGRYNRTRACFRSDRPCQTIYFRSSAIPSSCPGGWSQAAYVFEWAPGGVYSNSVRTCYICN